MGNLKAEKHVASSTGVDKSAADKVKVGMHEKLPNRQNEAPKGVSQLSAEALPHVPETNAVQRCIADLDAGTVSSRLDAIRSLGAMGHGAAESLPALVRIATEDPSPRVGNYAMLTMLYVDRPEKAVTELLKILTSGSYRPEIRVAAARALAQAEARGMLEPVRKQVFSALVEALGATSAELRCASFTALRWIARSAELGDKQKLKAVLVSILQNNPSAEEAKEAAATLSTVGQLTKKEFDSLLKLPAANADRSIRANIVRALWAAGPGVQANVTMLIELLKSEADDQLRCEIPGALAKIGRAEEIVPALIAAVKEDDSGHVRYSAVQALGSIGPKAAQAKDTLLAAMREDSNASVREIARESLTKILTAQESASMVLGVSERP